METREAYLVDAFTDEPLAGNAAGVVPNAAGLTDDQMQRVARELAVSETAFLTDDPNADRRVRYFTPTVEVDLCGHATIASHAHLFREGTIDAGEHSLATNAGTITVRVTEDGTVWMTQNEPTVRRVDADYDRLADALGTDRAAFEGVGEELPVAYASTGLPFLIVPVGFLDALGGMEPDFAAVERVADAYDATGVYAFTFDTLSREATLHARMFAPGAGVPEDPVTGTASGACGAYLHAVGAFAGDGRGAAGTDVSTDSGTPEEMLFEQGHFVDRPGHVRVRATGGAPSVGGTAAPALTGELRVPPADDDDIIEA